MRNYEAMYIINASLEEDALKTKVEKFSNLVTSNGGVITKVDEMGKRRLAYEIDKKHDGFYVLMKFSSEPTFIAELERIYRIDENIIKYLVISLGDVEVVKEVAVEVETIETIPVVEVVEATSVVEEVEA
ncbi:MAG: 30S ribosomal protein S6 [Clostridia bacterium]